MDDDEAAFFSRPKRQNSAIHNSPIKHIKGIAALDHIVDIEDTDDDSDATSDKNAKKRGAAKPIVRALSPKSQKKAAATNKFIYVDSSSDSEDTIPANKHNKRARKSPSRTANNKADARRARERSDSLTPPPQLSPRGMRQGKDLVQNVLFPRRPPSFVRETPHAIVRDEAEMLFEQQMRQQDALAQAPVTDHGSVPANGHASVSRQQSIQEPAPDDILEVIIRGVYVDLPSSANIIKDIKSWETPRMLRIRLNMKLSIAKIGFCKEAGMCVLQEGVKVVQPQHRANMDQIVLVHNNTRIFDHSSPHNLGIVAGNQPFFEAHTKEGWSYLEAHPELRARQELKPQQSSDGRGMNGAPGTGDAADEESIKITLRAKNGSELKVRVRPSTKITSIIAGFRDKHSIPDASDVALRFEGDVLEGTIGDTDVEDGDVIDVNIA